MQTTACHMLPNPAQVQLDRVQFMGSSGQNVDSIGQCCTGLSELQRLEMVLKWRHLAPTAPDILACYPMPLEDLFVLDSTPHVLFTGNQSAFATSVVHGDAGQVTRVICVPSFAHTGMIVLVNLKDLTVVPLTFQ
ncbi:hypothetical protein DYB37_008791 [Aphanomyces astaci]|uniref:DNA polymerase alpha/delta/epsilon subunit B domain-containing protein n=1 Tax=Aphanomyces astaci TaxID=112090 RepID=A0A3R6XVY5_APHAT|nr:hypothetical protein DYB37_008791 [Aphanomyces astaci]